MSEGALAGVKVLDAGRYVAGPWCAQLLLGLGAEVVRVERPSGGEDRWLFPVGSTDGDGAFFVHCNRGKKAMTLHATSPEGREIMGRLVDWADVIVANMPDDSLATMGLDWPTVHARNPRAVLATATTFGTTGPYAGRLGFDGIGQVMCGSVYMTGEEAGPPYRAQVAWVDFGTALHCAFGTMMALEARRQTGKGQIVEGALLATAVTFGNALLIEQAVIAPDRLPTGNRGQTAAPVDIFQTRDGWILVQVLGEPLFRRWAKLMGEEHWLTDARFKDDISRGDNGAAISERMSRWCKDHTSADAIEILGKAKIPSGPVLKPQQTLDDPHIEKVGFLQKVECPGMIRPAPIAKAPVWLSETPGGIRHRPPTLGEHTDAIMGELGYGASEIATLREQKVI